MAAVRFQTVNFGRRSLDRDPVQPSVIRADKLFMLVSGVLGCHPAAAADLTIENRG